MSFKREGDDQSQLNLLKKRRVSDLLADDIPEDEAILMSNGRYACTICHHRPVLDTIAMLLVHRQGKKHQHCVSSYYVKKQNLMKEVEKRKQQLYIMKQNQDSSSLDEVDDVAPLLTKTRKATHHALLKAAPYKGYGGSSRPKESHTGGLQGKTGGSFFQRVSQNSLQQESTCPGLVTCTSSTHVSSLPGNKVQSSVSQSEMTTDGPSSNNPKGWNKTGDVIGRTEIVSDGDTPSKSCGQNGPSEPLTVTEKRCPTLIQLKPYIPKRQRNGVQRAHVDSKSVQMHISTNHSDNQSNTEMSFTAERESTSAKSPITPSSLKPCASGSGIIKSDAVVKNTDPIPGKGLKTFRETTSKSAPRWSKKARDVGRDARRTDRENYLKLTSLGWKTDWKGGWVQDQDVEFDSDEDIPQ